MRLPTFIARWWHTIPDTGQGSGAPCGGVRIDREHMRHGAVVQRGRNEVRQVALILRGQLRVVTSGDIVEPWVYDALIARGILRPAQDSVPISRGAA